jgi:hypothetical protein
MPHGVGMGLAWGRMGLVWGRNAICDGVVGMLAWGPMGPHGAAWGRMGLALSTGPHGGPAWGAWGRMTGTNPQPAGPQGAGAMGCEPL